MTTILTLLLGSLLVLFPSECVSLTIDESDNRRLQPSLPPKDLYVPGLQTVTENGMILSNGLKSRLIATTFRRVKIEKDPATNRPPILNRYSKDRFHTFPDGAACFIDPNATDPLRPNYKYVSNSEDPFRGGVGAIEFNYDGEVLGYEMLTRLTTWNCAGGRTFYNTWMTCEEKEGGNVWEINPYPQTDLEKKNRVRETALGYGSFGYYEAFAYDNRNTMMPRAYITTDRDYGPLVRYTPSSKAIQNAVDTKDPSQLFYNDTEDMMTDSDYRPAKWDFLLIDNTTNKFSWTTNSAAARNNALANYKSCEGIDIRSGMMYVTCKREKFLFIFDLDKRTYVRTSTEGGAFDGQPDQIVRVLDAPGTVRDEDDPNEILYFAEDVATFNETKRSGVHGRNRAGEFFPIVQADIWRGEVSGLAFSPGNRFMYLAFQKMGRVYEISRIDGKPFHGQRLDIQYHRGDEPEEERR